MNKNQMQDKLINIINVLVSNKLNVINQNLVFKKIEPIIKQNYDECTGEYVDQFLINIKCTLIEQKLKKSENLTGETAAFWDRELEFECNEFDLLYSNVQYFGDVSLLCKKADLIDNIVNQICIMTIGYEW